MQKKLFIETKALPARANSGSIQFRIYPSEHQQASLIYQVNRKNKSGVIDKRPAACAAFYAAISGYFQNCEQFKSFLEFLEQSLKDSPIYEQNSTKLGFEITARGFSRLMLG